MFRICALLLCLAVPAAQAFADEEVKVIYAKNGKSPQSVKKIKIGAKKKNEPKLITITEVVDDNTLDVLLNKGKKVKGQNTVKAVPAPRVDSREVAPKEIYPELAQSQVAQTEIPQASLIPSEPRMTPLKEFAEDFPKEEPVKEAVKETVEEKASRQDKASATLVSLPDSTISLPENASAPAEADMQLSTVVTPASMLLTAPEEALEKLTPIPPRIDCYYSLKRDASNHVDTVEAKTERVFFFSDIHGMKGKTLIHEWTQDGKVLYRVPLDISQDAWRSWSSLPLANARKGTLTVLLKDADENVRMKKEIVVR